MKKLISVLMIVAMIASIAAVSTSAAGQVLMTDNFDGDELNPNNWIVEGNLFYVEEGWCKGWHDAVVNQSNFLEDLDGKMKFNYCTFATDIAFWDYDDDREVHGASLWWRDYRWDPEVEEEVGCTTYSLNIGIENREISLTIGGYQELYPDLYPEDFDGKVATYTIPEDFEIKVDASNPTIINLGMRVKADVIEGYLNGKKVISYTVPAELPILSEGASPLLLWNSGMYMGFDNFVAVTNDYQLFADDFAAPEPQPPVDDPVDPQPPVEGDPVDPQPPVEGDPIDPQPPVDNGEANPPAGNNQQNNNQQNNQQTNQGGNSNVQNGAQTGDAAIVVLAVMIVALGTAVAVKKISVR